MNILQLQDDLKNFSEEQLINEMRRPSGTAPQYLVLSEMNRRQRVKSDYQAAQASDPSTVAEEAVASAGVPASGIMGMAQAMAPKSESSLSAPKPPAMMMREGGVIRAQQGLSIADRNQNPGNMRLTNDPYFGTTGIASGYATFASPEFGLRGIALTADKYAKDPNVKTLKDFVEKYSPAADDNPNNKQYAKVLADSLGVDVDDEIDFSDDNVKRNLIPAITRFEGYKGPIDSNMVDKAIAASKVKDDEGKVNELLSGVDSLSGVKNNMVTFDERAIKPNLLTKMMTSTGEAATKDQKKDEPSFFEKFILGEKFGGTGGNLFYEALGDKGKAIADQMAKEQELEKIEAEEDKMGAVVPKNVLDKVTSQEKKFLTTTPLFSSPKIEFDKGDPVNVSEERSTGDPVDDAASLYAQDKKDAEEAAAKKKAADAAKPPTLDEQLVAMQQDLAKSREQDKYLALAQAGLAIMASDKPTLGQAIGEGAGVGLQAYRDAQERYQEGVVDLLNARAKLAKNKNTFGTKDILTRISAIDGDISKERENLNKRMMDNPTDKEGIQSIKDKIMKLTNLRDRLSVLGGFEPFEISSEARKKLIAGN